MIRISKAQRRQVEKHKLADHRSEEYFDPEEAQRTTNEAVGRVAQNTNDGWKDEAFKVVRSVALQLDYFTVDDVWAAGLEKSAERLGSDKSGSELGPVMRRIAAAGVARVAGVTVKSNSPKKHQKEDRLWKSLLRGDAGHRQENAEFGEGVLKIGGVLLEYDPQTKSFLVFSGSKQEGSVRISTLKQLMRRAEVAA